MCENPKSRSNIALKEGRLQRPMRSRHEAELSGAALAFFLVALGTWAQARARAHAKQAEHEKYVAAMRKLWGHAIPDDGR